MNKDNLVVFNKSLAYLLPMLGDDYWNIGFLMNSQFAGCFLGDEDYPELNNHIFVLYKFTGYTWWIKKEENLKDSDLFVHMYDPDKFHTMFVYQIPEIWYDDYQLYKQSKYSEMSEEYKQHLINFHGGSSQIPSIIDILYKKEESYRKLENLINDGLPKTQWTKIDRNQEASSLLNPDIEYYSSKYKKNNVLHS